MRKHRYSILFGMLLTGFTAFMVLDTFLISTVYEADATTMNMAMFADNSGSSSESRPDARQKHSSSKPAFRDSSGSEESPGDTVLLENGITENTYEDENISITIEEYEVEDTQVYVADITLSSAEYLKTAFAMDTYGKNVTDVTSAIAEEHAAILAVNGDNYGSRETGYVIRNGVVYRSISNGEDVLCIYADGTMEIVDSDDYTTEELLEKGVWQALCFGPGLIEDGEILVTADDEVGKSKASNPRTAIGIIDSCHYVLVVSDGRTGESEGLSLLELASFMQELDVTCAYNLDGGGSSTMVFMGQVVNNPTSNGTIKERSVNDIVYIG